MPPRTKPPGWTDDITRLTAAQLESMDSQQIKALDGDAGGTVAPTSAIRVEGAGLGSDELLDSTITGRVTRAVTGRYRREVDTTTITDVAGPTVLDMSSDLYICDFAQTVNIVVHLSMTTGETPVAGDVIEVMRNVWPVGGFFHIFAESFPAVRIGIYPPVPGAATQLNNTFAARYFFDGATWQPLRFSANTGI